MEVTLHIVAPSLVLGVEAESWVVSVTVGAFPTSSAGLITMLEELHAFGRVSEITVCSFCSMSTRFCLEVPTDWFLLVSVSWLTGGVLLGNDCIINIVLHSVTSAKR